MSNEANKGGSPSRKKLYSKVAKHAPKALDRLVELMDSDNPSVAVAAARTILAKAVPDLKAVELTDDEGNKVPIQINTYAITAEDFRRLLEARQVPGNTNASMAGTTTRLV